MLQADLDHAVANVAGESLSIVQQLGFGLADPLVVSFDPEAHVVDWDEVDGGRDILFPLPQRSDLCVA
jgi:hypothetical protein